MQINQNLLSQFEKQLNPLYLERSSIPAEVLGYGEISSIFRLKQPEAVAFKRLPIFNSTSDAETYLANYKEYCSLLGQAGITLPEDSGVIVQAPRRPAALYIAQKLLEPDHFAHKLIHSLPQNELETLLENVITEIQKIWRFNKEHTPDIELSIDGQLSNWALVDGNLLYVDTGTPMYRKAGQEQLDPEPLLKSAPAFLRWILRLFFLDDVMNRYYDERLVYIDLAANLYKEQRPDLIPLTVRIINRHISDGLAPVSEKEVEKYYKEDKLIWTLFLSFRRIDRWITTRLLRKRYEFILPGKIKR
ncbi:MAG TPA: hypothetical protein ENK44_12110 [Caldithrix abyssi]|uniref:Aminoglycoside phosphotransferase domain-containing protein n=1 Tax=Caldithrix abyssi TaxID=187145 RepID=A0A7V4U243_CALAY|nr:hypothetical protein [Caldithrix abyssi]